MERAYRVCGVPTDASAHAIKQAHRKLVRRWHPDLYKAATVEHSEASEMTRLINEAYSAISHAPLRYQRGGWSYDHPPKPTYVAKSENASATPQPKSEPRLDRIEFWVRFFCGAILGLFIALDAALLNLAISMDISIKVWLACLGGIMVGFGLLVAKKGDKFWYSLMEKWFE
jgi:curved DNA-binding protein CbpA